MSQRAPRRLWRRVTLRIFVATGLSAALSVALAGTLWTRFFMDEVRVQLARYTEDVVPDNLELCRSSPETFGRRREIGSFDAYDSSTLRSANPTAPPPDPALLERLEAGERVPARVDWSWSGALGGAAMTRVAPEGPCSLFELRWYAPRGTLLRLLLILFGVTVVALAGTAVVSTFVVVRPLARRLGRLSAAAEHVGDVDSYLHGQDREGDDIGELSRTLDRAHQRIRSESSRLHSHEQELLSHLEDVCHDLRTPLTAIQMSLEEASRRAKSPGSKRLIRSALTDIAHTSELTETLRLAAELDAFDDSEAPGAAANLGAVVERAVARSSLLGKYRGVQVDCATPTRALYGRGPLVWAERAVAILVHSAVSCGDEGSHVAVTLEAEGEAGFRLRVLDDGPTGSRAGAPNRIRKGSAQEPARRGDLGGKGLNLSVAAEICRRNGWRMRVEAREPRGLSVTLEGEQVPIPSDPDRSGATRRLVPITPPLVFREDADRDGPEPGPGQPGSPAGPEPTSPPRSPWWRRFTSRVVVATGTGAAASTLLIAGVLGHFMVGGILDGAGRYTRSVAADNVGPCLDAPETWGKTRRIGRLDAYDAATLRSANTSSPPLDRELGRRMVDGEVLPGRLFWSEDGRWGGTVLRRVAPSGPCSVFQLTWRAARGSSRRGFLLLVTLTVLAIGATMALSAVLVLRPVLSRLSALRRAAAFLGSPEYQPVPDEADDEIGRLARILDRTHHRVLDESTKLRERRRALERRLGDVAHDCRTPLSSALISLELAARMAEHPEAGEAIRRALTDVVYTAQLTENLRLLTQLSHGDEPPDGEAATLLNEVVERVVARFALLGRQRGVNLEGAVPSRALLARAHPVWAEQALANVAHNAVTHSEAGANVAVVLEEAEEERFRFTVVDDGPGVASRDLDRLARRSFRSGRARRREPGGRGLGLAITAEICRLSEWVLRLEPHEPSGLRVTVEGPLLPSVGRHRHLAARWTRSVPSEDGPRE